MRKQNTSILGLLQTISNLNVEYVYYSSTGETTKKDLGQKCVDVDCSTFPEYACVKRLFTNDCRAIYQKNKQTMTINVSYDENNKCTLEK